MASPWIHVIPNASLMHMEDMPESRRGHCFDSSSIGRMWWLHWCIGHFYVRKVVLFYGVECKGIYDLSDFGNEASQIRNISQTPIANANNDTPVTMFLMR